jgi:hypothetical protein
VKVNDLLSSGRRTLRWDGLVAVLVCVVAFPAAAVTGKAQNRADIARGTPEVRWGIRAGDVVLSYVQPTPAAGLDRAALRVTEGGRTRDIALDGTRTGGRARAVGSIRYLAESRRVVLHLDAEQDASGLLVVDLATDAVIDAVTAHDLTPSPDARYWAFEEHASHTQAEWPNTETVYAVYDAAAPPAANARPCPTSDERCRGQVVFLPDRLTRCHAIARERGGSCLEPGRRPGHVRRSPFVWLGPNEVAWVDVDLQRQLATLVLATLNGGGPADVRAVPLERATVLEDVEFPSAREAWRIDGITRDDNRSRVWLHFRSPLPQAPQGRLGIRVVS